MMRCVVASLLFLPLLTAPVVSGEGLAQPAGRARASLCAADEVVIHQCGIGRKLLSVCGSRRPGSRAEYRFGTPGRIELRAGGLSYAREMYSGGGALQIRFSNGGYDYAVYSRTVRTGFNGTNNPHFSDGVMVRRGGRLVSNRACTTEPGSDAQPEDFMPEGTTMEWFD